MPVVYVGTQEAIARAGLRMVVVGGIPSPWGEAAKGILHVKGIDWVAVRLAYDDQALRDWAGQRSAPVAILDDEPPRAGWAEILLLAERLAPRPALLPADPELRLQAFGLGHEICGEQGLGWSRRLQLIHAGLQGRGGFPAKVAAYLGRKYGYNPEAGEAAAARTADLLRLLAARLRAQAAAGSGYYLGEGLTAADIYSATFMTLFRPLPPELCPMDPATRTVFETPDEAIDAALDPILLAHRDRIYRDHLELPLSL